MNDPDYYKILGVPRSATAQEIRDRFRFLSHAYHPDKFPLASQKSRAEAEFKQINEAYAILSDEVRRRSYDTGRSNAQTSAGRGSPPVLERIVYFSAPPYPRRDGPIRMETYDYRHYVSKSPVPPTKIDTLVCDIWALATNDLGITATSPAHLSVFDVRAAIEIYMTRKWSQIRGYRPWTHWHFINRLTAEERVQLAEEAYVYILTHGIKTGQP